MDKKEQVKALAQRRKALGLRLEDVASHLLVDPATISNWENFKKSPHHIFLKAWQKVIEELESNPPPDPEKEQSSPLHSHQNAATAARESVNPPEPAEEAKGREPEPDPAGSPPIREKR